VSALPRSVDYRLEGAVTPVPDEGECSNVICAFGFTTAAEGVNKLVNGKLVPLSAQEGMACSDYMTCGCFLRETFDWFLNNQSGRVDTNESYPLALDQCEVAVCDLQDRVEGARINAVVSVPSDETSIQTELVKTGPITVEVVAVSWQTYTGGVMNDCQYGQIDHVAAVVGYTLDAPIPYWILKNWWGTDWGEEGYIYLAMGSNQCNMTHEPLTVHVAKN
jgi:C1A family cysteine protease